ncbi:hypothetical protein [Bradyrhizobium sp.]|uniref:hypothetical protein n=1 Tax=Bradyrhizobium sp. TaxID=376 RepID=UPI00403833F8
MHSGRLAYRYLDISDVGSTRTVTFDPSTKLTSGSSQKGIQAIRLVKSIFRQDLKCVVTLRPNGIAVACLAATEAEILRSCAVIEQRLSRLQQEPLTAKMVEEILSITSAELRRWSKDGRMPTAGRAFFGQGDKQVGLFVYPPDAIRELASRPDQLADWRRRDQGTPAFHSQSPPAH